MSALSESTAELLRARNLVGMLDRLDVACIFACEKRKPEPAEIPDVPAERLRQLGIVEGTTFARSGRRGLLATLSSLGQTVVDVLVLEGRPVAGVGVVKQVGNFLIATGGQIVGAAVEGIWHCEPRLSTELACSVIDMFPELRWT